MDVYYSIANAYPRIETEDFLQYCAASIGCWVRHDQVKSRKLLESFLRRRISSETSWCVARFISTEQLPSAAEAGHEDCEHAQKSGFSAHIHRVEKEFINPKRQTELEEVAHDDLLYRRFLADICRNSCHTFRYINTDIYAVGVTPNGDEFLPIWSNRDQAEDWLLDFPGSEIVSVQAQEIADVILPRIDEDDWVVGAGISGGVIATVHPLWLRDMISELAKQ